MNSCNTHIIETLKIVDEMIDLANRGDGDRDDDGCGILYGILRDSACKIKNRAEKEKKRHVLKGKWNENL